MKKRMGSILLCCALALSLLPWTATPARAEEERGKPMQDISAVAAGDTVWFGERDGKALAWRVLSPAHEKKLSSDEGRVLLISKALLEDSIQFDKNGSDAWAGSDAQEWCEDLYKNWPGAAEKAAIAATSVEETGEYVYVIDGGASTKLYAAPLREDGFFFLSGLEAGGFFADDGDRNMGGNWWLRSSVESGSSLKLVGVVYKDDGGSTLDAVDPDETCGARPAFNLDASKVLIASAVNGKAGVTGTFAPLPGNTTREWKLTLTDESRTGFDVTETAATVRVRGSVTLHCTGAKTGSGEYISALLYDAAGGLLGYASVSADAADGAAVFTLPDGLEPGSYQLKVFNERRFGDKTSDVVGSVETVSLTVAAADAVVLEAGDTVWFGWRAQKAYTDVVDETEYKPVAWRVLSPAGNETLPVSDAAHTLLISKNTLGYGIAYDAFSETVPDPWYVSLAKEWCDDLWKYWDPSEKAAIAETSLPDKQYYRGGYNDLFEYGPAPLSREHFFFLSAEEAETYFNGDDDRVAYRADECSSAADRKDTTDWWLRSPVRSASSAVQGFATPAAGAVSGSGWVNWAYTGGQNPMCYDARPAFNLDMSRVFFATAAVGGKASSDGSFVPMENTTHEWKLTLRYGNLSDIALAETAATVFVGGRVPLHYSGVPDMDGMSVSALLYDENGERVGYASVSAETASGTAAFTLPNDLEPGCYHLKVFNERRFGDCMTDLAGNAVTVELTVLPAPSVKGGVLSGQVYELGYTVKNAPEGALLIGALYDGSGRLSEVQTIPVRGDVQYSFYMRNVKDPVSVLILVDGRTCEPLCPAWRSDDK